MMKKPNTWRVCLYRILNNMKVGHLIRQDPLPRWSISKQMYDVRLSKIHQLSGLRISYTVHRT